MGMRFGNKSLGFLATVLVAGVVHDEDSVGQDQQRDVNQQERIEQGLKAGQLSTREAGRLEREQQHIEKMEARDLRNGSLSPAEQARLNAAQNRASRDIYRLKHNTVEGN